jgi:hypothetical protein
MSKFNRLKGTLKAIFNLYRKTSRMAFVPKNKAYAVVHLDTYILNKDMGRFGFITCQYLSYAGFEVTIKLNTEFFYRPATYKKLMLNKGFHFIRSSNQPVNTIYLYDEGRNLKIIDLVYGFHLNKKNDKAAFMPFPLHPNFYKELLSEKVLSDFRKAERKVRMFFAGNTDKSRYKSDLNPEVSGSMLSRVDVLDHLKESFKGRSKMEIVTEGKRLDELLTTPDTAGKIILSEAKIPGDKWLEMLAHANFYICLPGMEIPWSHNAIEAMSVGTIPVIQYGHLFTPALEHMRNCIAFNSLDELEEVVELALRMERPELEALKENVSRYFDEYLNPHAVVRNLNTFLHSDQTRLKIRIPYLNAPS